jgi:hypothetical protein
MLEPSATAARPSHAKVPKHDDPPVIVDRPKTAPSSPSSTTTAKPDRHHKAPHEDATSGAGELHKPPVPPSRTRHKEPDRGGETTLNAVRAGIRSKLDAMDRAPTPERSPVVQELVDKARSTRTGREWDVDAPLVTGRNAHKTNTPDEMRDELGKDFNWLEGDLRLDKDNIPVMSHDEEDEGAGLKLDEWLAIGGAGERGLKVDVKEAEAIPKLLEKLEASDIPDGRIMLNVSTSQVDADDVRDMRK